MRDQVMELLSTMWEGVKQAKTLAPQAAEGVLRDCYLAVQTIAQTVRLGLSEESVPQYTCLLVPLKALLEEMNSDIAQGISATEAAKKIKRHCNQLRKLLREEQEVKLEVVFFPYKASMWDALESIWLAAKNDPQCDAIVVPIPYYDRRPDGSLGEMHYEGGMFPPYVPIVDWQEYDLPARHPDVAFIHNPYDNTNIVTQVHSMYFSDTLKKYVGLLCYSPYFVVLDLDTLKPHFATLPAVRNADVVIVQSEEIGRQYLQVWEELFKKKQVGAVDVQNMQKKILPLGSPKFDAVARNGRETLELPEDWKRLIVRPDGTRKKVVFYNTSISNMLTYTVDIDGRIDDRYLNKLESVLRYFKRRKDAVLLWRPHPLLAQTFASMRSPLYQRYRQIVRDYKREGYGIYDDSDELHRAIQVCDMYYGDSSSVVALFQSTGKPLLLQDPNLLDYTKRFVTDELYYDGEFVWGAALDFNGLFRIHPKTYEIAYIGQFPGEKTEGYKLFLGIAEQKGKLYFCPYNAKHIAVYDKKTAEIFTVFLDDTISEIDKKFAGILAFEQFIYMQGSRVHTIVRIDTESDEITYIDNWVNLLNKHKCENFEYFIQRGCVYDGYLYYLSPNARGLLRIDPNDLSSQFIPLQYTNDYGFFDLLSDGELLWLLPETCENNFIAYFDPHTSELTELENINNAVSFCKIDKYIYYFSSSEPFVYKVNTKSKEITKFPIERAIYAACAVGNRIFMTTYLSGELYVFDTERHTSLKINLYLHKGVIPKFNDLEMINWNKKFNKFARESGFMNLESLIDMDLAGVGEKQSFEKVSCGNKIYAYVKGMVL